MPLTSAEHYREADEFDSISSEAFAAGQLPRALFLAQRAQVHATLALVVAGHPEVAAVKRDDAGDWGMVSSSPGDKTREFALVHIGTLMPVLWDWERLQDEFVGEFGVPIAEASLRDLSLFAKRLAEIRRAQEDVSCPF
jgi:hypothetical protein